MQTEEHLLLGLRARNKLKDFGKREFILNKCLDKKVFIDFRNILNPNTVPTALDEYVWRQDDTYDWFVVEDLTQGDLFYIFKFCFNIFGKIPIAHRTTSVENLGYSVPV